jgi:hypothetical protein
MKKVLIGLLAVLAIALIAVYVFIPSTIYVSKVSYVLTNESNAFDFLTQPNKMNKWWKDEDQKVDARFQYRAMDFVLGAVYESGPNIRIAKNGDTAKSLITLVQVKRDSTLLQWRAELLTGNNPIHKIKQYLFAQDIKQSMDELTASLQTYLSKRENVYGFDIQIGHIADTVLLATYHQSTAKLNPTEYYTLLDQMKKYIAANGALIVNPPMMHSKRLSATEVETMLAFPINKVITAQNGYVIKRMNMGNALVLDLKSGGASTTAYAMQQMDKFIEDFHLTSPAIPFESMITDRTLVTDTSKWQTRIYYPIF